MRSKEEQEKVSIAESPSRTRRRLIKGGMTAPLVMSVLPSSQLAASSATDCPAEELQTASRQDAAAPDTDDDKPGKGYGRDKNKPGKGYGRDKDDGIFDIEIGDGEYVESSEMNAASSCMVSAQGGATARRGGPTFGSYT